MKQTRLTILATILVLLIAFYAYAGQQYSKDALLTSVPKSGAVGWHIHALNDDVDATAELIARDMATTYAQLAAEDTIDVVSGVSDTTRTTTVYGVDSLGNKVQEKFVGTSGVTTTAGTKTFRYVENVTVDAECVAIMTVQRNTGGTFIAEVPVGQLNAQIAQHFNGEEVSYINSFSAGITGGADGINFELRWYPDDADCLDATDGYEVLDRIDFVSGVTEAAPQTREYGGMPIAVPKGGWLAVYGTGAAANCSGWATIRGYDVNRN